MQRVLLTLIVLAGLSSVPSASAAVVRAPEVCEGAPCRLLLETFGSGTGIVRDSSGRNECRTRCEWGAEYEERMTIVATPDSGSVFTGWVGECESVSGDRCHLRFEIEQRVYAVFDKIGSPPTPLLDPAQPGPAPPPAAPPPSAPPAATRPPPPEAARFGGCTVYGTAGSDILNGNGGREVFCAFGGNDHIHAGGGNDVIIAGAGNDVVEVHGGNDHVLAGTGADVIDGGAGDDYLVGGPGSDRVSGGSGADRLILRDTARDTAEGGAGRDRARADKRDRLRSVEASL